MCAPQEAEAARAAEAEEAAADAEMRAEAAEEAAGRAERVLARLMQANAQLLRSHETSAEAAAAVAQVRGPAAPGLIAPCAEQRLRLRLPLLVPDGTARGNAWHTLVRFCGHLSQAATMLPDALHSMQQRFATPQAPPTARGARAYAASDASVAVCDCFPHRQQSSPFCAL